MVRSVLFVLLCVAFAGCVDEAQVGALRSDASGLAQRWSQESRAWESRVAGMTADDPLRPDAEAALARAKAKEAAASAAVTQVDLIVARARNPEDPQGLGAFGALLPEPVRWPLALGAALVGSFVRQRQLKEGMTSIAQGLGKAMEEDAAFESAFKKHANTFRAIQTPTAKRVIDAAQKSQRRKKAA
jgi:hypothetical protein